LKERKDDFDLVFVDHAAVYLNIIVAFSRSESIPIILYDHNLEYRVWTEFVHATNNQLKKVFGAIESFKMRKFEETIFTSASKVLVPSSTEKEIAEKTLNLGGRDVSIMPLPFKTQSVTSNDCRDPKSILFAGTFSWYPNKSAISWFLDECWSNILCQEPSAKLILAGNDKNGFATKLAKLYPNVFSTGFVENIGEYFRKASVFILPMQVGAGIKIKFLEALSYGLPVVTTSKGIEGIEGVVNGTHCIVEDDPQGFSDKVLNLLKDREVAESLSINAMNFVEDRWQGFTEKIDEIKHMIR